MVKYEIRDATKEDVDYLTPRLREIDKLEIEVMYEGTHHASLMSGLKMSEYCKVGVADDKPFCIYGVRKPCFLSNSGIAWMLATDDIKKHAMKFGRKCAIEVDKMLNGVDIIENWCHADNKVTIRWLKWLGFKFEEAKPIGPRKELFHRFYMEAV